MKKLSFIIILLSTSLFTHAQNTNYSSVREEFRADTALVEQSIRDIAAKDYTTYGMHEANFAVAEKYDSLLNKYYKMLMNRLKTKEQKESLRTTQRNWIKLRDSEKEFLSIYGSLIYDEAGGGTMWGVIIGSRRMSLTRDRVFVLVDYLTIDEFE